MTDEQPATTLAALEQRVTEKLAAAMPKWDVPIDPIESAEWTTMPMGELLPLPTDVPQFPRERWITYPPRRAFALCLADRLIDQGKLVEAGFLVQFGGRERIS